MDQTQSVTTETNQSQIQSTQRRSSRTVQQKLEFCEWHITNGLNICSPFRHFSQTNSLLLSQSPAIFKYGG